MSCKREWWKSLLNRIKKKKRLKRIKYSLIEFWDKNNPTNNQITGALEEEDKKKEIDKMFTEIIVKNFPNMGKEIAT